MKTIIIFLMLFASSVFAQIDTVNFEFKASGSDGKYTMLTNKTTYLGKAAGEIVTPILVSAQVIDTANWLFIPIGSDGTYRLVENKAAFYGMDSGTVRAQIVSQLASYGTATADGSNEVTLNALNGIITTSTATSNGTIELTITNAYVTASSRVVYSLELSASDVASNKPVIHALTAIAAGYFTIKISNSDVFAQEVKIHFNIINQ